MFIYSVPFRIYIYNPFSKDIIQEVSSGYFWRLFTSNMLWDIIGIVAAGCCTGGLVPQILRGLKTKRLDDVSPWLLILLMVGTTLWAFYGIHIKDRIVIGANIMAFSLAATILFLRIKYSRKRAQKSLASEKTSVYAE